MFLHTLFKPNTLSDISHHTELVTILSKYTSTTIPHLLMHGPSGSSKQTILSALFQIKNPKLRTITLKTTKEIQISFLETQNCIQITPSDYGNSDKVVIQHLIKEVAQTRSITNSAITSARKTTEAEIKIHEPTFFDSGIKFIIINEGDKLTRDAQAALRRTVEKYSSNFRLVLVCEEVDAVMEALRSRCICMRVRGFEDKEISELCEVAVSQNFSDSEVTNIKSVMPEILSRSKGNLRKALCLSEIKASKKKTLDLEYERVLNNIVNLVSVTQDGNTILSVRKEVYSLLNSCIPARIIIKELARRFKKKVRSEDIKNVYDSALLYEERVLQGNKDIIHIEGFIVEIMCIFHNK